MAITAASITPGGVRPGNTLFGYCPAPPMDYGWLTENASYPSGGVLIESATPGEMGLIDVSVNAVGDFTVLGFLPRMSPRRQDVTQQTTGALPASALPQQRTLPAALTPNYANPQDEDQGGIAYNLALPGVMYGAHLWNITSGDGGTNRTASGGADVLLSGALSFTITVTAGAAAFQTNYATRANLCGIATGVGQGNHCLTKIYANPQPLSFPAGVVDGHPTNIVYSGANAHINPLVLFVLLANGSRLG